MEILIRRSVRRENADCTRSRWRCAACLSSALITESRCSRASYSPRAQHTSGEYKSLARFLQLTNAARLGDGRGEASLRRRGNLSILQMVIRKIRV